MRAMLFLVVAMGVLIVAGTATVAVTIVSRMSRPAAARELTLDQPAGTHIVGVASVGNQMAITLQGGGPDRIVMLPPGDVRLGK